MPVSVLARDRLLALLPARLSEGALYDLLFASKAEIEARDSETLTLSATPDRLDLLSEGGLALYLQGATDSDRGLPKVIEGAVPSPPPAFLRDQSVRPVRPFIAGALVRAPDDAGLDAGLLAEAIRFQELLHATVGRDRRAASLGIYPWDRIASPVRYALEPFSDVTFVPLDGEEEESAERFYERHPMALRYGPLGRSGNRCLTLRDADGTVLSLPPVLNSRSAGEARVGDRTLLLEATGTQERSVLESVGLLLVVFVARRWSVAPVAVEGPENEHDDGRSVIAPRSVDLPSTVVREVAGEPFSASEVERRLTQSRLRPHPQAGGWRVEVPPWRPDLLTAVDLAEDVVLAAGVRPEGGILPPSPTRGRRRAEVTFRRRVASLLLGLGFAAPHTPLLVSEATVARWGGSPPIRILNPVSTEFAYVRDRLFLSHLDVLAHNTRHSYPQRFGEVAPVVVRSAGARASGETRHHAGMVVATDSAGFADAAALVDYLLRSWDVVAVREPVELPGTIPGRAARVRIAGEAVAEIGEVHPRLLTDLGVPVPAVWSEVDLTAVWPLVAHHDSHK